MPKPKSKHRAGIGAASPAKPPHGKPRLDNNKGFPTHTPGTPAVPGVPSPTVAPFLTAQDLQWYGESLSRFKSEMAQLMSNLQSFKAEANYEKEGVSKQAVASKVESSDTAAGRGLFRSSIRDADLFDIDATAEMRKRFLDTQVDTLERNNEVQEKVLNDWRFDPLFGFEATKDKKAHENAAGVQNELPEWSVEPIAATPPSRIKPGASQPIKPKKGGYVAKIDPAKKAKPAQKAGVGVGVPSKPPSRPKKSSRGAKSSSVMGKLYG